ncbi:unnamed protein product [Effrenium voratum]|nr:unnamed protein product [Effrenium voratum]
MKLSRACKALVLLALGAGWSFSMEKRIPPEQLSAGDTVDGRIRKRHFFQGWWVDIGATTDALLEFEEAADGYPEGGMKTWCKMDSLSARVLAVDAEKNKIWITCRSGPLDRPPQFRQSPTEEDIKAFSDVPEAEWLDGEVCGLGPNGAWIRLRHSGRDCRTLLPRKHFPESLIQSAHLGMKVPVRVTDIDVEKRRLFISAPLARPSRATEQPSRPSRPRALAIS